MGWGNVPNLVPPLRSLPHTVHVLLSLVLCIKRTYVLVRILVLRVPGRHALVFTLKHSWLLALLKILVWTFDIGGLLFVLENFKRRISLNHIIVETRVRREWRAYLGRVRGGWHHEGSFVRFKLNSVEPLRWQWWLPLTRS